MHHADQTGLRRRQIRHDIHHELGTIMMLASLLSCATDVGPESRQRARQIIGEARWLDQLHRAYEETVPDPDAPDVPATTEPIRLDLVGGEVVAAMKLCAATPITFACLETWAHADRLAAWRALRNVLGNAIRAAGTHGHVDVRIFAEDGWAVAQVDDDGPGFGSIPPGLGSLGLGIVQDLVTACGGELEISRRVLGGCGVRLRLPAAPPARPDPQAGSPCES
jgi:signal transduction histidine kinase